MDKTLTQKLGHCRTDNKCLCCGEPKVSVAHDSDKTRVLVCAACRGTEIITKSKSKSGVFWYHGARLPEAWPPEFLAKSLGGI